MIQIAKLTDIDPNHNGSNLYIKKGTSYYPILRLEIRGSNAFKLEEAKIYNTENKPYIPDSEKSVYIKTPIGALYETNHQATKFSNLQQRVTVDVKDSVKIFQPYLSWHGGQGGKDLKPSVATISLRGMNSKGGRTRYTFNSSEAIAKDSFAAIYNPIASVAFPRTISSYPPPVSSDMLYKPLSCILYDDVKFTSSQMYEDRNDIVIDYSDINRVGFSVVVCVHIPSSIHISRFIINERSKWIYEPITFTLFDDVSLACSLFFIESNVEVVLDDAPLIFVGYSLNRNENIAFTAFKVK